MGFARASLVLLVTLPGCGLLLDTQTPEDPHEDVHVALDAATPDVGLDAAPGADAFADDALGMDAPQPDAFGVDAFGLDTGSDAQIDASFDPTPDAGRGSDAGPPHPCPTTFCGPAGETIGLPFAPLGPSAIDLDVSENGTRVAVLTGIVAGGGALTIVYGLSSEGAWVSRGTYVADASCHHVAVSDDEDMAGVLCGHNVSWVGSGAAPISYATALPTAIASGGRFFAVAESGTVRVYSPGVAGALALPVGPGRTCPTPTEWTPDSLGTSLVTGLAMRSEVSPPGTCDARPRLVAGRRASTMFAGPRRISNLVGVLGECTLMDSCCSTPIDVDYLYGTDISVLDSLVVSASDSGRPSFSGATADRPAVPLRMGGPIVSVSLGRHSDSTHFSLGSVHLPTAGRATAWLQLVSRAATTCDPLMANQLAFASVSDSSTTLSKIRISDCSPDGWMTAAVLEMPTVATPGVAGTARVFRVRCPR